MDSYAAKLTSLQEENTELTRRTKFHAPFDSLTA